MSSLRSSRRHVLLGAAALAVASRTRTAGAHATPEPDTFPITITHMYGDTVIEAAPKRVLTIGWSTQDAVIALGVTPIAIPADTWAGDEDGFLPWTRAALGEGELPETYDDSAGLPMETFVGLMPDLILAPYSGITADEYETLSAIAPTVAPIKAAWASSWQDTTQVTGNALGLSQAATDLIEATDKLVSDEAAKFPELAGKSYIYGNFGDGTSGFNIYTKTDPRPLFLESIGLVPAPLVEEISADPDNVYFATISYEEAITLVADIVVFWFTDQAEYEAAMATPVASLIPAVQNGTFAAIIGREYVMATSAFSTLSIPFALEEFLPTLAAAAANVQA